MQTGIGGQQLVQEKAVGRAQLQKKALQQAASSPPLLPLNNNGPKGTSGLSSAPTTSHHTSLTTRLTLQLFATLLGSGTQI
ncbi:hypothetical protein GOP47_0000184 [Adiantum capillus-veneris]|uniref:Uncharacterized protein n=1 Tax=Adiantum capillus-veneris TaxID=13818 RepID=A0A9D4VCK1_ADICA|nr:hypothetical protein GOP47_0000184 [Adiantum capillus-veneris]